MYDKKILAANQPYIWEGGGDVSGKQILFWPNVNGPCI